MQAGPASGNGSEKPPLITMWQAAYIGLGNIIGGGIFILIRIILYSIIQEREKMRERGVIG